ncbi:MAG TPA: hypothetical protein VJ885_05760 [Thermoanaerobaculia bacterium]|nr:hypothetical protein [Thermoanaerobaculia bacterium]
MPEHTHLDLSSYTEATRRALYDRIVSLVWTPTEPEEHVPSFTPDEGGLTVMPLFGRWFAFWKNLDEPEAAEDQRVEIVRVQADPDSSHGITLFEV